MIINVPLSWLKAYCDIPWPVEELGRRLTMAGLEVEGIKRTGAVAEGVVVGAVLSAVKHPNADRLSLCTVSTGTETLSIVCGAPNVAEGQRVAVAPVGVRLPNGIEIRQVKIRGIVSNGMICSEAELGLSDEADGILVLPADAPVGQPLEAVLGAPETILSIDIGTNRADCLALIGVAREVVAQTHGLLKLPDTDLQEAGTPVLPGVSVTVEAPADCPRFVGRVIRAVTVGPSPEWMVNRLQAAGVRSINNVVDVTNYVMLEMGQPLHAYDLDTLAGHALIVRRAGEGERFTTLDGGERVLTAEVLMIADQNRSIGLAGVMGGLNTEITDATTNLFLEGACFDPGRVRRSSKLLRLSTDASRRFERGVDPELQALAVDRAAKLIAEVSGGSVVAGRIDVRTPKSETPTIRLRTERVKRLLGVSIPQRDLSDYLTDLGFCVIPEGDDLQVHVPSFRRDVTREVDLIEEVARIYGYDRIPPVLSQPTLPDVEEGFESPRVQYETERRRDEAIARRLRDTLTGCGLIEVVTHSFVHPEMNERTAPGVKSLLVGNPLSPDLSAMRTNLAASVLNILAWNVNRQMHTIRLFELARVYRPHPEHPLPDEPRQLCMVLTGNRTDPYWGEPSLPVSFFDIKGLVEVVLDRFVLDKVLAVPYDETDGLFHPELAVSLVAGSTYIGSYGRVSDGVQAHYGLREPVWMALLDGECLYRSIPLQRSYTALPKFPAIERDLAVVASEDVSHQAIAEVIQKCGGTLLEQVVLFDVYHGKQVPDGKRSLAYALRFRAEDRTLTDDEVTVLQNVVVEQLQVLYGAELRA